MSDENNLQPPSPLFAALPWHSRYYHEVRDGRTLCGVSVEAQIRIRGSGSRQSVIVARRPEERERCPYCAKALRSHNDLHPSNGNAGG